MTLRAVLRAARALACVSALASLPAVAQVVTPPGSAVFGIAPGANPTAATVVMTMPSGAKIPIGTLNPTTGSFSPFGLPSEIARAQAAETANAAAAAAAQAIANLAAPAANAIIPLGCVTGGGQLSAAPLTVSVDLVCLANSIAQLNAVTSIDGGQLAGFRNFVDNSNFRVNVRSYTSGTALAALTYGFDRWEGGNGGGTLTFTAANPDTTVNITAGTLVQVIPGSSLDPGPYTLSWQGSATCRAYQSGGNPLYLTSPISYSAFTSNNATVECTGGTLSRVQFEKGTVATAYERKSIPIETTNCQRFAVALNGMGIKSPATGSMSYSIMLPQPMRGVPTATTNTPTYSNGSGASVSPLSTQTIQLNFTASAAGGFVSGWNILLSSDL